jgi:hypothetical protein
LLTASKYLHPEEGMMTVEVNSEHGDQERTPSGLLLSVEPLQASEQYVAAHADDTDTDSDDAYPGDETDVDSDETDADADGTDYDEADSDDYD